MGGLYEVVRALVGERYLVEMGSWRVGFGELMAVLAGLMGMLAVLLTLFSPEKGNRWFTTNHSGVNE